MLNLAKGELKNKEKNDEKLGKRRYLCRRERVRNDLTKR